MRLGPGSWGGATATGSIHRYGKNERASRNAPDYDPAVTDLRRLEYFLGVARERNFTRAAERLHVAQPALSRQVRLLERELGVELLHRTTHEFELTEAGRFLLERGPAVLAAADELWRAVGTYGTGERGSVVVAYGASASYETAPRLLRALAERRPGIAVTTQVKSVGEIVAGLDDGSVDLGIVRCPPERPDLELRTIRSERQGLLVRRDHPLAERPGVGVADLAGEQLLMHAREANPGHYDAIIGLFHAQGVEPRVLLRTLTFDLAYTPVASGEAVAIVGESSRTGLPDELCWVPLAPDAALAVSLVARRHKRSPAVAGMLDTAMDVARELGWA
jgi:DNA-binding transcriptional LysR family regulator